jgi:hypothetical protein
VQSSVPHRFFAGSAGQDSPVARISHGSGVVVVRFATDTSETRPNGSHTPRPRHLSSSPEIAGSVLAAALAGLLNADGKWLARMLLFKSGMDAAPYPPSSAPKLPRLGRRFGLAGEGAKTATHQFNQAILANILLELTVTTVCGRTADVRSHG